MKVLDTSLEDSLSSIVARMLRDVPAYEAEVLEQDLVTFAASMQAEDVMEFLLEFLGQSIDEAHRVLCEWQRDQRISGAPADVVARRLRAIERLVGSIEASGIPMLGLSQVLAAMRQPPN